MDLQLSGKLALVTGSTAGIGYAIAEGLADTGLGAAIDDDAGAFRGQGLGDGEADAAGRAGDEGEFTGELEVHVCSKIR